MTNDGFLQGPKKPFWGCSCGESSNFASRLECRGCGKPAPARIAKAAKAADAEARAGKGNASASAAKDQG
eukprot:9173778-Karenia_brevis.AAC.1